MAEQTKGVTFEQVEKVASSMLTQGVKPTVRGIMAVTGGKTEVVSKHLRDFFEKRDTEVSKMADEIGSSSIAKLIAGEIQILVDKRTAELSEIKTRQKETINELVELLEEKEAETERIKKDSLEVIEKEEQESAEKINAANAKAEKAMTAAKQAESESEKSVQRAENLIIAAEEKAKALVDAANKRADLAEQEAASLREQVKLLSIDEAKREIEKTEFDQQKQALEQLRLEFAEQKTGLVEIAAEKRALQKDVDRLEADSKNNKHLSTELAKMQALSVEVQKQLSDVQGKLALSERERESLSSALTVYKSSNKSE